MHTLCLVVGDNPERELEPFSEHLEVARHQVFLDREDVEAMAEHFGLAPGDLEALAGKMPEWQESDGGVDSGRLYYWSMDNPNRKFDWYKIGGTYAGYLHLREPLAPSAMRRLLGAHPAELVDQARKNTIREDLVLDDPPAAILVNGEWHESPITIDAPAPDEWKREFHDLFAAVPADALLTVVDVHS